MALNERKATVTGLKGRVLKRRLAAVFALLSVFFSAQATAVPTAGTIDQLDAIRNRLLMNDLVQHEKSVDAPLGIASGRIETILSDDLVAQWFNWPNWGNWRNWNNWNNWPNWRNF